MTAPASRPPSRLLYIADLRYGVHAGEGGNVHIRAMQQAFSEFMEVVQPACPIGMGLLRRVSRGGRPSGAAKLLQALALAIALPEKLLVYLRTRPALVYVRHEISDVPLVLLLRLLGARIALEVNAFIAEERAVGGWRRHLELLAFRAAHDCFTVSDYLKGRLVSAGVPRGKIAVTHNGVHVRDFPQEPAAFHREAPVIGFVGTGHVWHGLPALVRAFAGIRSEFPRARLLVVGPGSAELTQEIETLGISEAVTITGLLPHGEALEACRRIDIAVMPNSNPHGSPLKIFEYMALGKTIVAANTPAISEILVDGSCGLLVEPNSSSALAAAFRRLLTDPELCERLGSAARCRVLERFTWRGNALAVLNAANLSPV